MDTDVGNDADHRARLVVKSCSRSPYRALTGKVAPRRGFIDHDNAFIGKRILPGDVASLDQSHPHRSQITGTYDTHDCARVFILAVFPRRVCETPASVTVEGQHVGNAGRLHAGNGLHLVQNLLQHRTSFFAFLSFVVDDVHDRGVAGIESKVNIEYTQKTAEQQSGSDQQDTGERDFAYRQGRADTIM